MELALRVQSLENFNRLAERAVQFLKQGLKKTCTWKDHYQTEFQSFCLHITEHLTAQLEFLQQNYSNLKVHLDLVKPNISQRVEFKQQQQKSTHDSHAHA